MEKAALAGACALAITLALAGSAVAAPAACPAATAPFADGVKAVHAVRVFTGPDGESHFEDLILPSSVHEAFNTGKSVEQTVLGPSAKVSLVSGPPNIVLPMHPSPKAMFIEIAGSSVITVKSGEERELKPGMVAIFDDADSKSGHGGRTGPCGYVVLSVAGPAAANAPAAH